jgi:tagatose 6-phosphate kinase
MILCIGTTPAVQRVMVFPRLTLDAVNRATLTLEGVAGKSVNVAKVLKAVGEEPMATGFLGGDRGEFLRSVLATRRIESDFVSVAAPTRQCITVIDQSAGTQTELVEESQAVAPADYSALIAIVRRQLRRGVHKPQKVGPRKWRAVVMSGTITPGGPPNFYLECVRLAHEAGALSVVDAQGAPLIEALKARPGVVKPNRSELAATVRQELKSEPDVRRAMRELCERGAQRVVITSGKQPSLAYDGRTFWRISSPPVLAVNPIGSGDAFTAGLTWRLLRGDDFGEACRWAAAAGAANALTLMAGEVNRKDLKRLASQVQVRRLGYK